MTKPKKEGLATGALAQRISKEAKSDLLFKDIQATNQDAKRRLALQQGHDLKKFDPLGGEVISEPKVKAQVPGYVDNPLPPADEGPDANFEPGAGHPLVMQALTLAQSLQTSNIPGEVAAAKAFLADSSIDGAQAFLDAFGNSPQGIKQAISQ